MNVARTPTSTVNRPLEFSFAGALLVYLALLLHITFGGSVRPVIWLLVLLLPAFGAFAQLASQRLLWRQVAYLLTGVVLALANCLLIVTTAQSVAVGLSGVITGACVVSVVLVAIFGYLWGGGRTTITTERQGGPSEAAKRREGTSEEPRTEEVVIPARIRRPAAWFPVGLLTIAAASYAIVRLVSLQTKVMFAGLSALIFAFMGAMAAGFFLRAAQSTLAWEREHGEPLLLDAEPLQTKRR